MVVGIGKKILRYCLNIDITFFHYVKNIGYRLKNVLKGFIYLLDYFQIYSDIKLIY
jgi:hypothetical protein